MSFGVGPGADKGILQQMAAKFKDDVGFMKSAINLQEIKDEFK